MSKNRYINTHFWDDFYIFDLDPIEKLLFLYFLTNPQSNIAGAYEIHLKQVALHTGVDVEMVQKILTRFESKDKIIYRDGWILIVNFIKHQAINPNIEKGIVESVKYCPDWIKERLGKESESLSKALNYLNLNLNSIPSKDGREKPAAADSSLSAAGSETPAVRRIWKDGVDLIKQSGIGDKAARSLLGKLAKDYGNERLAEAIAVTQSKNPVDTQEFLIATLNERKNGGYQKSTYQKPPEKLPTLAEKQAEAGKYKPDYKFKPPEVKT